MEDRCRAPVNRSHAIVEPSPSRLDRNAAGPAEPPSHAAMGRVDRLTVHQRTTADDRTDIALGTCLQRCLRDTAVTERTVKPDMLDPAGAGLSHELGGNFRVRNHHEPVDDSRHGRKIRIAHCALDSICVRVDRNNIEAAGAELAEDGVGSLSAGAGHAGDGEALAGEKFRHGRGNAIHKGSSAAIVDRCKAQELMRVKRAQVKAP